ncbi:hypothetical protein [Nannocystis pusilla]|uniref:hypothetical protein n=1 Tax=Nannocystis pusilla TaxID=889268 RepID=UPI003DA374DC
MSLFLAHLLVLQPPTATPASSSRCDLFDKRCKAEQSLQRARTAKNDEHRARYYFYAYRDFLLLFDQTGETEAVCKARRAFDQSVAVKGQSSAQRASFMAEIEDLVSRERKAGVRCQNAPKRPAADPPRLAKKPAKEPATTATSPTSTASDEPTRSITTGSVDEPPAGETAAQATTAQDADPLLPVTGRSPAPRETPRYARFVAGEGVGDSLAFSNAPTPGDVDGPPAREWRTTPRPGRELLIAGGVTLSVGLGLSAAAGVMGGRMLETWRESRALHEEAGPYGTVEQADRHAALERDYDRQRPLMVTTATIGVGTLVVGAVLTGVGAKRLARATSRAMLLPAPGGLVVRARF